MKRILSLIALLLCTTAYAQTRVTTASRSNPNYVPTPWCQAGQMLNILNAYSGTFIDTPATGTSTTYLYTAIGGIPVSAADTFVPYPLFGNGTLTVVVNGIKISGTPNGIVTFEESVDGVRWGPCKDDIAPDATADSVLDVATVQAYSYTRSILGAPFKRVKIALNGTQQSAWTSRYYFNRNIAFKGN